MKIKSFLVIFISLLLVSCTSSNTINPPELSTPDWGYSWCIGDSLYLSTCYVNSQEIEDMQVNVQYYKSQCDTFKILPFWDRWHRYHCVYIATHIEDTYECHVYHTDECVYVTSDQTIPLDCYVVLRYNLDTTLSLSERLVDVKVFRDINNRSDTEFTLLLDEVRYSGKILINE